jgi:hypothetical protein
MCRLFPDLSNIKGKLTSWLTKPLDIEPLIMFRIMFGLMMLISTIRFIALGWIDYQYIDAKFHFKYFGFEWVQPMGRTAMYMLHLLMMFSAFCIMVGFYYRLAAVFFFLAFTYCELIDKTYYLNHYYFISIVSLLIIFLPAEKKYSLDVGLRKIKSFDFVPAWTIYLLKFQIGLVYFMAGIAKLNQYWLFEAMPLKIWLPAQSHLPLIGWLFKISWMPYVFSWAGAVFDLSIPFILLSRFWFVGFAAVVVFHTLTGLFFQIGMFPVIMICSVPVFFPIWVHKKIWSFFMGLFRERQSVLHTETSGCKSVFSYPAWLMRLLAFALCFLVLFQLLFPFRYLFYPGNRFWTEEGYRFGWRVMLMEKAGSATFFVKDGASGKEGIVVNSEFLNEHQEKQMAMQPDMILEFAHFLARYYKDQGMCNPEVRVEAYVTLNGRRSRLLINPEVNLTAYKENLKPKEWLLPFDE